MKYIIYSLAILQLLSSCAAETPVEENLTIDQMETSVKEENKLPDLAELNLPNEPFVFDNIAEIKVTAKANGQDYQVFSSSDPIEFERMSKVMSTTKIADPGCLFLGIIHFSFEDGSSKFVEFNCHKDCHYVTYFTEDAIVTRELTQDGIEYINELLTSSGN